MEKKIKVSVLMPSYNVSQYIRQCIESVLNQTLSEIEIICIDAGSTDGTLEVLKEYALKDSRVVLLHSDKKSYGYQMNMGIKAAKGEYIGIVETDDFIATNMYEMLYKKAKTFDADVVKGPYIEYLSDRKKQQCYYAESLDKILPKDKCFSLKEYGDLLTYHASVWTGIYKTNYLLSKNIYFVEAKGAGYVDVGFKIDTLINSDKLFWDRTPYYYYRVSNSGSSTNQFNTSTMIDRWVEVHNKFERNIEDYNKYYGQYLILDEYLNTLAYIGLVEIKDDDFKKLIYNYSNISEDLIDKAHLNNRIVKNIKSFKKNPDLYWSEKDKYRYIYSTMKKVINYVIPKGTTIRIKIKKAVFQKRDGK